MVCVTTNANHPFESGHGRAEWYPATDIYVLQYECTTSRWAEHTPHCQHTDTHRTHPHTYTVHTHTHAHMESMALWAHGHNDTGTAGHIDTYTYTCTHIHLHTHTPTHTHTYKHITHITLPYLCIPTAKPKGSTLSSKVRWHSGGKHSELVSFAKSTGTTGRSGYYWYYWWLVAVCILFAEPKGPVLSSKVGWHSGKHAELVSFTKSTGTTGRSGYYWYYWWLVAVCILFAEPKGPVLSSKVGWHSGKHAELVSFTKSKIKVKRVVKRAFQLQNPKAPHCSPRWFSRICICICIQI